MTNILPMADDEVLQQAAHEILAGGLVAFATDTVYGVGAVPTPAGISTLQEAKRRAPDRPISLLLAHVDSLSQYASHPPPLAVALAERFWPGALTIVVPGRAGMGAMLGSSDGTVGLRVPDHPRVARLLSLCGGVLAVTSANRSGQPAPRTAADVERELGGEVELILDGGVEGAESASTVVAVSAGSLDLHILRRGDLAPLVEEYARTYLREGAPAPSGAP